MSEAKAQLTDLVRRAEAGDEVILTRHGVEVARLTPVVTRPTAEQRQAVIDDVLRDLRKLPPYEGPSAARSQDFLYDDLGLPK